MKLVNKEMLNVCYKFFNRFITASELVVKLKELDCNDNEFKSFVEELDKFVKSLPNCEDDYVRNEKAKLKNVIDKLKNIPDTKEFKKLNEHVASLKKDYERDFDSHERWFKVVEFIDENEYFNESFDNLSKYELLEFIAQYICAPFPPQISEDEFIGLINEGIKHDEREWIWRMALNYERSGFDFTLISDYFIKVKDGYYLVELISAVRDVLDIDSILDKLTDDELIKDIKERKNILDNCLTKKQMDKLMKK